MRLARPLIMVLRAAAGIQVLLGIAIWMGRGGPLVNLHMAIGGIYVLALWILGGVSLAAGKNGGLAIGTIVWGFVVAGFGAMQVHMLVGDAHWVIRVLHLVIALAAMPMAERLAKGMGEPATR